MQENANIKLFALEIPIKRWHKRSQLNWGSSYVMLQSNISVMVRSKSTSMKVCGEMMVFIVQSVADPVNENFGELMVDGRVTTL